MLIKAMSMVITGFRLKMEGTLIITNTVSNMYARVD
jgi:hypothetical protein